MDTIRLDKKFMFMADKAFLEKAKQAASKKGLSLSALIRLCLNSEIEKPKQSKRVCQCQDS